MPPVPTGLTTPQVHICSAMVTMYILGVGNDVIIEQSEATCSCDCLLGHRAITIEPG